MAGYYVAKHMTLNKNLDDKTEDKLEEDLLKIFNDNMELIGLKIKLKKGNIDYGKIKSKNSET